MYSNRHFVTQQTLLICSFCTSLFHHYFCALYVCIPHFSNVYFIRKFSRSISNSSINRKHQEFTAGTTENAGTTESYKLNKNRTTCFLFPCNASTKLRYETSANSWAPFPSQQLFTPYVANAEHQQEFLNKKKKKQKNLRCADWAKVGTKSNSSFVAGDGFLEIPTLSPPLLGKLPSR